MTEAVPIHDDEEAFAMLNQLRQLGGTNCVKSVSDIRRAHPQRFPFDKIKIDRCFTKNILSTPDSLFIAQAA